MDTTTANSISHSTNVNKRQAVHAEFIKTFGQHSDLSGIIANETLLNFFVQTLQELLLHIRNDNTAAIRDIAPSTSDSAASSSSDSDATPVSHTPTDTDTASASTTPPPAAEPTALAEPDALLPQAANDTDDRSADSPQEAPSQPEQAPSQPLALENTVNLKAFLPEAENDRSSIVARTLAGLVGNFAVYPENASIYATEEITIEDRSNDPRASTAPPPPQYVDPHADYKQQWWL